jgi:hypothetical protein
LLLNLVDKAKIEIHLHWQLYIRLYTLVVNKANIERNEVGTTRIETVRIVLELPLIASHHEKTRVDALSGGYLFFGTRVALDQKQVIPVVCAGINGRRGAELAISDDRYTGEQRHDESCKIYSDAIQKTKI